MSVEDRRRQLLDLGMELFSTRAYDDIWIEEVADRAGVSRGLLYHYFPTKRDFYVAVTREAASQVAGATRTDPALSPMQQIRAGLEAFLDAAEARSEGFLTAYRGRLAGDSEVRAIVAESRDRQARRVARVLAGKRRSALVDLAAHGWVALVQDVTAQWLEDGAVTRDEVRDLLMDALRGLARS